MKKVKIMLTAITVFAVVGGALAFKAKTLRTFYCTDSSTKACTEANLVQSFSKIDNAGIEVSCSTTTHTGSEFDDACGTIKLVGDN